MDGGRTRRSLVRAARLADGWAPFGLDHDAIGSMLDSVDRAEGFEVVLGLPRLDPVGEPEAIADAVGRLDELGATTVQLSVVHRSLDHYLEQLEAFATAASVPSPAT